MSRLLELLDELQTDLSVEAGEAKEWELRETLERTVTRLKDIRAQAVKSGGEGRIDCTERFVFPLAEGGE